MKALNGLVFPAVAVVIVAGIIAGCSDYSVSGPGYVCDVTNPVADLFFNPGSSILFVHSPARATDIGPLKVTATNRNGGTRTDVPITFVSSDTAVATVDSLGVVHAKKPGTLQVTASTCGRKATANITVALLTTSVKVKLDTSVVIAGDSVLVRAQAIAQDSAIIPAAKFTFAVTPASGITIIQRSDSTAIIKTSSSGTFTITATGEGATGSAQLRVLSISVKVKLDSSVVIAGDSVVVRAQAVAEDSTIIRAVKFTFGATPPSGITITRLSDSTALVKTVLSGTFTIAATGRGVTGSTQLVVLPRVFVGASVAGSDGGLDLGRDFGCGLIPLGRLYCWGVNGTTQLATATDSLCFEEQERGAATRPCSLLPLRVGPTTLAFSSVSAGDGFACGIASAGASYCWGGGNFGKLGNGHNSGASVASLVTSALAFRSISAGGEHACGLTVSGAAYCWGQDSLGQLGDARHVNSTTPIPVILNSGTAVFASISAGYRQTCALQADGAAYCWGRDSTGELGTGNYFDTDMPSPVAGGLLFASISAGGDSIQQKPPLPPLRVESHTCAITTAGAAYCWGSNRSGQLGNGGIGDSSAVPVPVAGGLTFAKISAGSRHTCGLTTDGAVYCWGRNLDLQLGRGPFTGTGPDEGTPQQVTGGELPAGVTLTTISAGTRHSCAVGSDGNAYCWGSDVFGALGNTLQAAFRGLPQRVAPPK